MHGMGKLVLIVVEKQMLVIQILALKVVHRSTLRCLNRKWTEYIVVLVISEIQWKWTTQESSCNDVTCDLLVRDCHSDMGASRIACTSKKRIIFSVELLLHCHSLPLRELCGGDVSIDVLLIAALPPCQSAPNYIGGVDWHGSSRATPPRPAELHPDPQWKKYQKFTTN